MSERDVIARALACHYWPELETPADFTRLYVEHTDAILAALHDAGYEVVKKRERRAVTLRPKS